MFKPCKILVIGDVILDTYVYGNATRLSQEAPVPVVLVDDKKIALGGAANVCANLRAYGA
jgi:bifunctional ADP-heptose synthase (sugar kinase/adenylyltransferase)